MWFSPLKGAHLTLGQLDKTLPVDTSVADNKKIERGSFVYINAVSGTSAISPRFALYTNTQATKPNAVPYIALMGVNDFQAGMAGNVGQAPKTIGAAAYGTAPTAGTDEAKFLDAVAAADVAGPRITAISVVQPGEYQTSAFETTSSSYYVGEPLTISANGKLTHFVAGSNIVGYVTAVPAVRWVNDLGASENGARISGGNVSVMSFSTAWIPATATVENTKALNVGSPKVSAAAAPAQAPKTDAK